MNFPGFYGNSPAKSALSALLRDGRLPQAILFQGPEGCGKRTLARLVAQAAVCEAAGEKPCGVCAPCRMAAACGHPDIITVGGSGAARSFGVDQVRFIRRDANIKPNQAGHKIYILENAHTMTEQAQNALLKIMEEPPSYACFLLTCESAAGLLPTVVSRAAVVTLSGVAEQEAAEAVARLCPNASEEQTLAAARAWGGNIGRMAASLTDGTLQRALTVADEMAGALLEPAELPLLRAAAPLIKEKDLSRAVFGRLSSLFHQALSARVTGGSHGETPGKLAHALTKRQLTALYERAREASEGIERYANHALLITYACARLREAAGK